MAVRELDCHSERLGPHRCPALAPYTYIQYNRFELLTSNVPLRRSVLSNEETLCWARSDWEAAEAAATAKL